MKISEVKQYFGSFYRASKDLCISPQTTVNWKKLGYIPIQSQMKIEKLTAGNLKANLDDCREQFDAVK